MAPIGVGHGHIPEMKRREQAQLQLRHKGHAPDDTDTEARMPHRAIGPELSSQTIDRPAIGDPHVGRVKPEAEANIIAA